METRTFSNRPTTWDRTLTIVRSRAEITNKHIGEYLILTLRGDGNTIDVKDKEGKLVVDQDGIVLRKRIWNTKCNSRVALENERNKGYAIEGRKAELAGNAELAATHYSKYLQAVEVSIGLLDGHKLFDVLADGDQIKGQVQEITTPNGRLLTLDPKTISLVKAQCAPMTSANFDFMMALPDEPIQEEPEIDEVAMMKNAKPTKKDATT